MRPAARLLMLLALAALGVGAALELANVEGRTAALAVATAALTGFCLLAAGARGADRVPDEGESVR